MKGMGEVDVTLYVEEDEENKHHDAKRCPLFDLSP
jgi:hypothetical protein